MAKKVSTSEFKQESKEGTVFVDFYADWCGPCKMLAPLVEQVSEEVSDVKFLKVNVDEEEDLAREYQVMSIPTLVIIKDGKLVSKKLGFMPKNQLIEWINQTK